MMITSTINCLSNFDGEALFCTQAEVGSNPAGGTKILMGCVPGHKTPLQGDSEGFNSLTVHQVVA